MVNYVPYDIMTAWRRLKEWNYSAGKVVYVHETIVRRRLKHGSIVRRRNFNSKQVERKEC